MDLLLILLVVLSIIFVSFLVLVIRVMILNKKSEFKELYSPPKINEKEIVTIFKEFIQFRTISHKDYFESCKIDFQNFITYLEKTFPFVHKEFKREIINSYSLLYTSNTTTNEKPILLMGHYDVVPIEKETESQWQYDPFSGAINDGYIWGRGSIDDKAGVFSILYAVEHLLSEGYTFNRNILLSFGHDEEIGGAEGIMLIAKKLKEENIEIDFVIDEGGAVLKNTLKFVNQPIATIGIAEKGYLSMELSIKTSGGHSSMPIKPTAIGRLSQAVVALEKHQFPTKLNPIIKYFLEKMVPYVSNPFKFVLANLWLFWPLITRTKLSMIQAMSKTTTAVTMINSGTKDNILPTIAKAVVNHRIIPGETVEYVIKQVKQVVSRYGVEANVFGRNWEPSKVSPWSNEGYKHLNKAIKQIFPEATVIPNIVLGATDSRHFSLVCDNIYRFRPLEINADDLVRVHGINERISIDNLVKMVDFYIILLKDVNNAKTV